MNSDDHQQKETSGHTDEASKASGASNSSTDGVSRRGFLQLIGGSATAILIRRFLGRALFFVGGRLFATETHRNDSVSFILVGDFGAGYFLGERKIASQNPNAQAVADGIRQFAPIEGSAYLVSLGDQIYEPYDGLPSPDYPFNAETWPVAGMEAYDQTIGELYAPYIRFPRESRSSYARSGSTIQRFLAILGDHDWWHQPRTKVAYKLSFPLNTACYPAQIAPDQPLYHLHDPEGQSIGFTEYFSNQGEGSGSGNCRYWDVVRDNVHWLALSSDPNEVLLGTLANAYYSSTLPGGLLPDGLSPGEQNLRHSLQGKWFRKAVSKSSSPWKFVITHYPPLSSSSNENGLGGHPSSTYMQWDYHRHGVDAVFSGHVHGYERLYADGVLYIVNGAGGTFKKLAGFVDPPLSTSRKRVSGAYGFMTAREGRGKISFTYYTVPPQTALPYQQQRYTAADTFTLLHNGTLKTFSEIDQPASIFITRGGGRLDLSGFDALLGNKLQGRGTLRKTGRGTLRLTGANPDFEGPLLLQQGKVELLSSQTLHRNVAIVGRGGELILKGVPQSFSTPLDVQGTFTIRLDSSDCASVMLHFADSSPTRWSRRARLTITGTLGLQSIRFGHHTSGLTRSQLSRIRFEPPLDDATAALDDHGYLIAVRRTRKASSRNEISSDDRHTPQGESPALLQ